ncbi:MAG TPA: phage tail protein [Pyrinomonadaceae bacterium]|nr:phage tail protein [Pyrinomonadaceae bacterium]
MSGGALGRAAGSALNRGPTNSSVLSSTLLLAGSQALGILLEPTGVKRATFNDFSVSPGEASDTVSYIAGTVETVPHLISYFDFHSKKVKNDVSVAQMLISAGLDGLAGYVAGGGTFGLAPDPPTAFIGLAEGAVLGAIVAGLGQLRTASYRYYCGFLYGICHGVIDSIEAVKVDERIVSFGAPAGNQFLIDDPQAWGGDHVDGGVYALAKAIPGHFWPTQGIDPYIAAQLGANTSSWSGKALFLVYGFSGYPESGYFAATPQGAPAVRPIKLRVRRLPNNLGVSAYHDINGDANIAECCYEWLTSPTFGVKKLPLSKIDLASFQLGAQTHFDRGLGISIEMNADTDVETALDKFTALGDSIIYYSFNSGMIRYKVIERDYSFGSLPVFRRGPDGSSPELYNVIKVDGFTPGTWASTANDFSFDYVDRDNNYLKATRYVQDTANKMLTGRTRSLSQSLDGVSNGVSAALVGTRELRAGSYPRPPFSLTVNRDGYTLEPGSVIKYIDNVDNFVKVLRVAEVQALATDETTQIQLNCTEDQYGVGAAAFEPYVAPGFSLTLHMHFELEDSLSGLSDALNKLVAVTQTSSFSDSLNLSDAISVQLRSATALSLSDSVNNLADSATASLDFSPTDIASLNYWLNASNLVLSDGDPVVDWLYTGTKNYGQNTGANQPTYKENIVNGNKPVVRFATDDKLIADPTALSFGVANTVIVVCTPSSTTNSYIWGGSGGGGTPAFISGFSSLSFEYYNGGSERATFAASTSGFHILSLRRTDDGTAAGFFDGASAFSIATDTAVDWNSKNMNEIGANGGGAGDDFFNGDIRHILHFNAELTDAELNDLHTYLGNDCGISITLI